jgi:hypothetical protein
MEVILEKGWVSSDFVVKSKKKDNTVISGGSVIKVAYYKKIIYHKTMQ